jgi:hypothetical protein
MHASAAFAGVHWCLRLTFLSEMNPGVTFIKAMLWCWQQTAKENYSSSMNSTSTHAGKTPSDEIWSECLMAVWGQCVGFIIALVYIVHYLPLRKSASQQCDENNV